MKSRIIAAVIIVVMLLIAAPAVRAQEAAHKDPSNRGTTGLFSVPTSAVLGEGEFSIAAHFATASYQPGDSSVETSGIGGGFAFGALENLEVFGVFTPRVGIHRVYEVQRAQGVPFSTAPRLDDHPFATERWRTGIGDLNLGAKYRFFGDPESMSGVAILGQIKLPTSDTDDGIGTGKVDATVGLVGSAEAAEKVGITGYVGGVFRSSPDEIAVGNKLEYGIGLQVPSRSWVSAIFELTGAIVEDPDPPTLLGAPVVAGHDPVYFHGGFRLSHENGVAFDGVYVHNLNFKVPDGLGDLELHHKSAWQAKLSYSRRQAEPIIFTGAGPMDLPPVNRPPTLTCRAERTTVREGESVRLFATVNDPDGDTVTVSWNTQAGSLDPREGETVTWSSQGVRPGSGPINVRATDGFGGVADCSLTITVEAAPPPAQPRVITSACAEFPSGNTRIDNRCKAILDDVALQLRQNPSATAVITGHSDSVGAADVNDRMAQERADNARAYLVDTHGIATSRIQTASAGSSQPVGDNTTAEGRLQNRRIVVVVTIPAQ
ncbi:MAG TPA: OmpA family protein [Acidobacteriota bacterium]